MVRSLWLAVLVAAMLVGCSKKQTSAVPASPANVDERALTGTIDVDDPRALQQPITAELSLRDVSSDGPEVQIALQHIKGARDLPINFRLPYDATRIDANHRYTLQARIYHDQTLLYATDTAYPVITQGNPTQVKLQLARTGAISSSPAALQAAPQLKEYTGTITTAAGTANYVAYYDENGIARLAETRAAPDKRSVQAQYQFKGAQVVRYQESTTTAASADSTSSAEYLFDEHGKVVAAKKIVDGAATVPTTSDFNAVRNRASLLRNHAQAMLASKLHAQ